MSRIAQLSLLIVLASATLLAADTPTVSSQQAQPGLQHVWSAHLRNGFSIRHARREERGNMTRLWLGDDRTGYVDVPTEQISGFEEEQVPLPPSAQPAPQVATQPVAPPVSDLVRAAGERTRIDPEFLSSVIRAESGFNPRARSPKGAQGLMQLMPQTATTLGVKNPFDAQANIAGGSEYLRELLVLYHGDAQKALAAYNAGPHRVSQYGGVPPYRETRAYIRRVITDYNRRKTIQARAAIKPPATSAAATRSGR